jgi:hypothetical protein
MERGAILAAGVAAIVALFAAPAFSQPAKPAAGPANIAGNWTFQTQTYSNGCKMYGQMVIAPNATGRHVCTFKTEEHCPDVVAKAQETCTATRAGAALTIKSQVKSVSPAIGYDPDDFELKIENSARMTGMMRSFNSAPVEFFRGNTPTS